jgi:hypothetical protein
MLFQPGMRITTITYLYFLLSQPLYLPAFGLARACRRVEGNSNDANSSSWFAATLSEGSGVSAKRSPSSNFVFDHLNDRVTRAQVRLRDANRELDAAEREHRLASEALGAWLETQVPLPLHLK